MSTLGFIGLGAMGGRIAGRLLDAGHRVYGTNRTAAKGQPLIERGLIWGDSPRAVATAADVVFSMVADDAALEAIVTGPDGILAGLAPGKVYVDMSTVSPQTSRRIADRVSGLGAHMLDAPVSGSIPQVQSGTLAIMVGGDQAAFAAVQPLLRELGQTVTHIGPSGQGLLLKLAINISLAVQTLAFSEGLLLAERGGVDPELAADVMSTSSIGSPMLKARIPLLLHLPEHAWFDMEMMQKDIRLARDAADELAVPLPSAAVADEILSEARERGYAHRDLAGLHEVLAHSAGHDPDESASPGPRDAGARPGRRPLSHTPERNRPSHANRGRLRG
jgi:3-hydroxyisobutyrate dehydrogenase-like beta-hydroxyacid dehydrogenase